MTHAGQSLSVMQVILTLERAGAQEVVRTLAEHLQHNGCAVVVCAFEDGPMRAEIERLGIPVTVLRRPRWSVFYLPLFLKELGRIQQEMARLAETYHVNVIQTHILQVLDFVVLGLRNPSRIVLWTMQNVEFFPKKLPGQREWPRRLKILGYRWLYRLLSRYVDGIVAVSDEVRNAIIRQIGPAGGKIEVICNAVNPTLFGQRGDPAAVRAGLGLAPQARLVAAVGRLTEQKGHRYLIEAAPAVVRAFPEAHFLFIGAGELRDELAFCAQEAGVAGSVHFLGQRGDVPDLLAAVDIFALPSLWEGLSVALLEAMAAGLPIVATAVSGTTQAMCPGETGLVVPPRDSGALAEAIIALLSDPARARAMGEAARQHVTRHYGAQKQAEEHITLYRRLLAARSG